MNTTNTLKRSIEETNKLLSGLGVALATPLEESGMIAEDALRMHISEIDDSVDFYVLGSTGEIPSLRPESKKRLSEVVITSTKKPIVIYALGLSRYEIMQSVDLMMNPQVVAVMHSVLGYQKLTQQDIITQFEWFADFVAQRFLVPTLIYDVPSRTGLPMSVNSVKHLSNNSKICGIKDANGKYFQDLKKIASKNFAIICGDDPMIESYMRNSSCRSLASVVANVIPKETLSYMNSLEVDGKSNSDYSKSVFLDACDALLERNPEGVKHCLSQYFDGKYPSFLHLPLQQNEHIAKKVSKFCFVLEKNKIQ